MSNAEHLPDCERWQPRLTRWGHRLRATPLHGIVEAAFEVLEPLGPLGAQVLWTLQPTLSLFGVRDDAASLARLLDAPGGVLWLREHLVGQAAPPDAEPLDVEPPDTDQDHGR